MTRYIGVDLAWSAGGPHRAANETGLAVLTGTGVVVDAGWAVGIDAVTEWIATRSDSKDVIAIDAPLVVTNPTGMRAAEREVAQRYMSPWGVGANASNLAKKHLEGIVLRQRLEALGLAYTNGSAPYAGTGVLFECYPYTTITGAPELGYEDGKPRYKRRPKPVPRSEWRAYRARECDDLISRIADLGSAEPPLDLQSHPVTAALLDPSPLDDRAYKHREDLLDAVLCAWTASLWHRRHLDAVQILGLEDQPDDEGRVPTIVAPARDRQRRSA